MLYTYNLFCKKHFSTLFKRELIRTDFWEHDFFTLPFVWGPILQEIKEDEDFLDSEELVEKVEKNLEEELPDLNDIEMEKVKVGPKNAKK